MLQLMWYFPTLFQSQTVRATFYLIHTQADNMLGKTLFLFLKMYSPYQNKQWRLRLKIHTRGKSEAVFLSAHYRKVEVLYMFNKTYHDIRNSRLVPFVHLSANNKLMIAAEKETTNTIFSCVGRQGPVMFSWSGTLLVLFLQSTVNSRRKVYRLPNPRKKDTLAFSLISFHLQPEALSQFPQLLEEN